MTLLIKSLFPQGVGVGKADEEAQQEKALEATAKDLGSIPGREQTPTSCPFLKANVIKKKQTQKTKQSWGGRVIFIFGTS